MRFNKSMLQSVLFRALIPVILVLMLAGCGGGGANQPVIKPEGGGNAALDNVISDLDNAATPEGVDPAVFEQLRAELKRVLEEQGGVRQVSAPPVDDNSSPHLTLDGGSGELTWRYYSTGDYDQNGEVNISDLTPLGVNFGKTGSFDPNSVEAVVDGDNNGEINIADVTPIGQAFGTLVSSYNVYSSTSFLDPPNTNDGPNGAGTAMVDTVPFGNAQGNAGVERLYFNYTPASNPPGTIFWVRPNDGSADGTASSVTVPEGDTLTPEGGAVQLDNIIFSIPSDSLVGDVVFSHSLVPVPGTLPPDFTAVGEAHDIGVDHPEWLNAPAILEIPYDDTGMGDEEENLIVLHYNGSEYEPVTIISQDTAANTVTVDTRSFSTFILGLVTNAALNALPGTYTTGFAPGTDGWNINNFGSYFSPGGNCLGMSGYGCWFFDNRPEQLFGKFDTTGGAPTSIAHLTATRAMLAQSQYWALKFHNYEQTLGEVRTGRLMRYFLWQFNSPLILSMTGTPGGHACIVYGWDDTGFKFYDVNFNSVEQKLPWDSVNGFGNYAGGFAAPGFTRFGFTALPSLGRTEDFEALTVEAEGGFTGSDDINLTSPTANQEISGHEADLTGTLAGSLNTLAQIVVYVKGVPIKVPVGGGSFNSKIPISNGENTLIILAGVNINQQSNWYQNSATLIRNVKGTAGLADLLVTLTWNQDNSDVDLYVTEPGGETSWYFNKFTSNGLELDVDNTAGYGPEHITLNAAEGDTIQPGAYQIAVHYFRNWGAGPVSGNVSVLTREGTPNQTFQNFPFSLGTDNPDNDNPGSNGADWRYLTTVTLQNP